ncbi:MAG: transcriptional repressor LexA [Chromatiales bacterium]|jgi:repressor LexA
MSSILTRRQQEIYDFLVENAQKFPHPPTLSELCKAMNLSSRGSMHKQVQALIEAGLVEPMNGQRRGIRLTRTEIANPDAPTSEGIPFLGKIAAGQPLEAVTDQQRMQIPAWITGDRQNCYILSVSGDSMIEEGILDGDLVIIEQTSTARNDEIVVALVDESEVTLKRIEQKPGEVTLHPANSEMQPMHYSPDRVRIQGRLVGQLRTYH